MTSQTKTARERLAKTYLRWALTPFFVYCLLLLIFAAWVGAEPISGDLTRIGRWSEQDFGARAKQPVIHIAATGQPLLAAPVLVLGDSFSAANYWQSLVMQQSGFSLQTYLYVDIDCMSRWLDWAINQPGNDTIIIESVERAFIERFSVLAWCPAKARKPLRVASSVTEPMRATWPPIFEGEFLYQTAFHTLNMTLFPRKAMRFGSVTNAPLKAGCASFSNRRADRLLYLSEDEAKSRWQSADIDRAVANSVRMQALAAAHGKRLIIVVVPDKFSVYRDCLLHSQSSTAYPDISAKLQQAGVTTPALLAQFKQARRTTTDLYNPNNTHWSPAGYYVMADDVLRLIKSPH